MDSITCNSVSYPTALTEVKKIQENSLQMSWDYEMRYFAYIQSFVLNGNSSEGISKGDALNSSLYGADCHFFFA